MGTHDIQYGDDTGYLCDFDLGRVQEQFYIRYKIYDMIFFDYFLLMKFHFFQYYYPEVESVYKGRKYGYNIKSQLLKLLVIFPAASALAARICTLFYGC